MPLLLAALLLHGCGGTSVTELTGPGSLRCQIALGSSTASVPASGGQVSVGISVERDCTWSARSDASWVQVSPASGQGESALTLTVAANGSTSSRTASVTVNGNPFQVMQSGATPAPPPCVFVLTPSSRNISEDGGVRTVRVTTTTTCAWSASTTVPWITILSARTGSGPADITYRVDQNRSPQERTGAVVVSGASHTVHQDND